MLISITALLFMTVVAIIVFVLDRNRKQKSLSEISKLNSQAADIRAKDQALRSATVNKVFGGKEFVAASQDAARDRSTLFPESTASPKSSWTDEDLNDWVETAKRDVRAEQSARFRFRAGLTAIVLTVTGVVTCLTIYSFQSGVPANNLASPAAPQNYGVVDYSAFGQFQLDPAQSSPALTQQPSDSSGTVSN